MTKIYAQPVQDRIEDYWARCQEAARSFRGKPCSPGDAQLDHILQARKLFREFETRSFCYRGDAPISQLEYTPDWIESWVQRIESHLGKSGFGIEALDPNCAQTESQMRGFFNAVIADVHIAHGNRRIELLRCEKIDDDDWLAVLKKNIVDHFDEARRYGYECDEVNSNTLDNVQSRIKEALAINPYFSLSKC